MGFGGFLIELFGGRGLWCFEPVEVWDSVGFWALGRIIAVSYAELWLLCLLGLR